MLYPCFFFFLGFPKCPRVNHTPWRDDLAIFRGATEREGWTSGHRTHHARRLLDQGSLDLLDLRHGWVSRNWRTKHAFYISELDLNDMKLYKYHEISKIRPRTWIFDQLGTHFQDVWTWSQKRLQDCDLLLPMNQDAKHRNRTRKHAVALLRMC